MANCLIIIFVGIVFVMLLDTCKARDTNTPLKLTFIKEYQIRNFFNSAKTLFKLNISDKSGIKERIINTTQPGCTVNNNDSELVFTNTHKNTQESFISLGELYPYAAIDMDISSISKTGNTASAILMLYKNEQNHIAVTQHATGKLELEIYSDGKSVMQKIIKENSTSSPFTLRIHLCGQYISFLIVNGEKCNYLEIMDISHHFDLRKKELCNDFAILAGAKLGQDESVSYSRLESYLTCGTGQADPKVLHYENGEPMVGGDKIWLAMTTRGYDPIPSSHQGIYSYNIKTREWKLVGDMCFDKGDGVSRQWHASDIFYDRNEKKWRVFTVSHGDDHRIYFGTCDKDPRKGISIVNVNKSQYESVGNEEDPSVIYDESIKKWRMAICMRNDGYQTVLMESSSWTGPWKEISRYTPTSSTGILIQKVEGEYYVFIGRGRANYEVLSYPHLQKLGKLNVKDITSAYNVWPVIIPIKNGNGINYYMLTFDREQVTGRYSYGELYWYKGIPNQ